MWAGVIRAREVFDPGSLTCIIFDPMGHSCFSVKNELRFSDAGLIKVANVQSGTLKTGMLATFFKKWQKILTGMGRNRLYL